MNNMDKMMEMLGQRLGMESSTIKNSLQNGDVSKLLSQMNSADAKKFKSILDNKTELEKIIKSPIAKDLMKKMNSQK